MFKDILKLIEKHKLIDKIIFSETKQMTVGKKIQNSSYSHKGVALYEVDDKQLEKLNYEIQEIFPDTSLSIQKRKIEGCPFQPYVGLNKLFGSGTATLSAIPGQILLIGLWQSQSSHSRKLIALMSALQLKNHKQWGKNLRIVAINIDDENTETEKKLILSEKWDNIQHLALGTFDDEKKLISDFPVSELPFVCLVDAFGIIYYVGKLQIMKLQKKINELISASPGPQSMMSSYDSEVSMQTIQKYEKLMKVECFKSHFNDANIFTIKGRLITQSQFGKISHRLKIFATLGSSEKNYLQKYNTILGNPQGDIYEENVIEQIEVPSGSNCSECGKVFQNQYYYWCRWEPNPEFRCNNCINIKDVNGNFKYLKNSILTKGNPFMTSQKRLGNNILPSAPTQVNQHNFLCNGCGGNALPKACRYICIGCRPQPNHQGDYIDLCENCIQSYIIGSQEIRQNLQPEGHQQNHPFLRVLHSAKTYYDF